MILVKFPSRSRPSRFLEVLKEWIRLCDDPSKVHFLFSFDMDDQSMWGIDAELEKLGIYYDRYFRKSDSKVHAINRDMEDVSVKWDILLVISDDMWPKVQGWDTMIRARFVENPDSLVWYPDQKQKAIVTLPLMDRAYYERDGFIYDPRFTSVFCDDLQTDMARARGRLVFVDAILAEHRHPANITGMEKDDLYKKNETDAIWAKDQALYKKLKPAA